MFLMIILNCCSCFTKFSYAQQDAVTPEYYSSATPSQEVRDVLKPIAVNDLDCLFSYPSPADTNFENH